MAVPEKIETNIDHHLRNTRMEKTTLHTIEDERIKFVREKIAVIEDDDLLAKPTGSCPNAKSPLNIEQVVTYKPVPIEEAQLSHSQHQSNFNLDKVTDINDEDEEDIDEDEPVEPPKLADGKPESLVAFSFADKQELTQKIMNLDPQSLASIIQIVQKFEKIEDGAEIELDIDRFSSQTLHALQEFIHTGLVPEYEEGLDLLNEDNKVVQEARKILETGSRRQVKTPQKYNPLEQIRQEVNLYRKKTHDKLLAKKKEEKQKSKENEGADGTTACVLTDEELGNIQKEVEEKVKKFLKEQDAEKDMEWFKSQFVVQTVKDDYFKGVEQAVQYIGENMFLEDSTLLNCLLEDELLQIDNENVYAAVIELIQKIFAFRGRQRLEADAVGSFYSLADQAKLFSRVTEDMNRIRLFATSMRNDDTVDCVSYQSTLEDMFEGLMKEVEDLFKRRARAFQREELEIAYHIHKNAIEKKSAEYHILYHAVQFYVMVEEHLTETLEIVYEWYENLFGGDSDDEEVEEEDDDDEDEEEAWDQLEARAKRADAKVAAAKKKPTPASAKKKSKFAESDEEDEESEDDDLSDDEEELPKFSIKVKSPTPKPSTPALKNQKPAAKPAKKAPLKKKSATLPDESEEELEEGEESVKSPTTTAKSAKKNVPVDTDCVYEFKTMNIFIRDLQKSYLVPAKHVFTALAQDDLKLVVMKVQDNTNSPVVLPQGLKSVDVRAKPSEISLVFKATAKEQMTLQQLAHFTELHQKISSVKYPFPQQYLEDVLNYYCYVMPQNRALLYVFVYVYLPFYCNIGVKADGTVNFPYLETKFLQSDTLSLISMGMPIANLMKDEPKEATQPVVSLDRLIVDLVTSYYQAIYKKHPRVWEMQRDPQMKLQTMQLPKKDKTKIDRYYANKPTSAGMAKGTAKTKSPAKSEQVAESLLTNVLYPPY